MQGRLSKPITNQIQAFPTNSWKTEFELAQKIGFNCIEWIFEHPNKRACPLSFYVYFFPQHFQFFMCQRVKISIILPCNK